MRLKMVHLSQASGLSLCGKIDHNHVHSLPGETGDDSAEQFARPLAQQQGRNGLRDHRVLPRLQEQGVSARGKSKSSVQRHNIVPLNQPSRNKVLASTMKSKYRSASMAGESLPS